MANEIQKGINEASFHPSLINGIDSSSVVVTADYTTSEEFKGFKFVATKATAKTSRKVFPNDAFTDISASDHGGTFTQAAGTVTSTNSAGFLVQNREFPLSQNEGTCIINFSDANPSGRWMAGLSRINGKTNTGYGRAQHIPKYFEAGVTGTPTAGLRVGKQWRYADICVTRVGDDLRVFQSGSRTIGTGGGIYMNEVIYYGTHNADFGEIYDLSRNNSSIRS